MPCAKCHPKHHRKCSHCDHPICTRCSTDGKCNACYIFLAAIEAKKLPPADAKDAIDQLYEFFSPVYKDDEWCGAVMSILMTRRYDVLNFDVSTVKL